MNYQSIGSGGGIAQIKAKTVDFGASDMPLKPEDLQAAGLDAVPGDHRRCGADREPRRRCARRDPLHRSRAGGHLSWQDQDVERQGDRRPKPGAQAASQIRSPSCADRMAPARRSCGPITCRRRARNGREKVGSSTAVAWPEGVGGKGNEGVAAYVQRIKGLDRLRRVRVREEEQDDLRFAAESRRRNTSSPTTRHFRRLRPARTGKRSRIRRDPHESATARRAGRSPSELHPDAREAGQAAERGGGA